MRSSRPQLRQLPQTGSGDGTIRTNSATLPGVPMPARASSACRRLAPRQGEPCMTSSGKSRGERQYKGDALHGTVGSERSGT